MVFFSLENQYVLFYENEYTSFSFESGEIQKKDWYHLLFRVEQFFLFILSSSEVNTFFQFSIKDYQLNVT